MMTGAVCARGSVYLSDVQPSRCTRNALLHKGFGFTTCKEARVGRDNRPSTVSAAGQRSSSRDEPTSGLWEPTAD
jgi:hypothetical protein